MENQVDFWELSSFKNPRYKVCFFVIELLALNAGDFDFDKNQINITKSRMLINGEITTPKTKYSVRLIDMPAAVMQQVKSHIDSFDEVTTPLFKITVTNFKKSCRKTHLLVNL